MLQHIILYSIAIVLWHTHHLRFRIALHRKRKALNTSVPNSRKNISKRYWGHTNSDTYAYIRNRGKRLLFARLPSYQPYCLLYAYWRPVTITKSSHNHKLCTRLGWWFFFILFHPCLNARKYVSYSVHILSEWVSVAGLYAKSIHNIVSVCCKMFEIIFKRSSVSIVAQCRHFSSSFDKTKQNKVKKNNNGTATLTTVKAQQITKAQQ